MRPQRVLMIFRFAIKSLEIRKILLMSHFFVPLFVFVFYDNISLSLSSLFPPSFLSLSSLFPLSFLYHKTITFSISIFFSLSLQKFPSYCTECKSMDLFFLVLGEIKNEPHVSCLSFLLS